MAVLRDVDIAAKVRAHIQSTLGSSPEGGCRRDTIRCPDARSYQSDLRPCCRGHIRQIVADCQAVFEDMGIVWWADYGTLLGAVRNPLLGLPAGIIPHDKDADFGLFAVDYRRLSLIRRRLERDGYQVLVRPGGRSMKVRLSMRNHTNADFFIWNERPDGTLFRARYISVDQFKGRDCHKSQVFPLTTVPWEDLTLPAPVNPEAFCEFRYGPNWKTPLRANNDGIRRGVSR